MLAAGHMALGAVVGAGTAWAAQTAGADVTPGQAVAWTAVVTGFAVAPDIDHPRSTVSRLLFPARLVWLLARLVLRLAAGEDRAHWWMGHRRITHDLAVAVPAVGLAGLAVCWAAGWPLWLAAAATLGWAAHIAGDWPTMSGVPLGMPWSDREWAGRWFKVGSWVEVSVVYPLLVCCASVLGWVALAGTGQQAAG